MPLELVDRTSGSIIKKNPRVLSKGMTAKIRITVRGGTLSDASGGVTTSKLAVETFKDNKDMGRVILRRSGETIAAGMLINPLMLSHSHHKFRSGSFP
jgi:elongation factor 1 alpha-like protein